MLRCVYSHFFLSFDILIVQHVCSFVFEQCNNFMDCNFFIDILIDFGLLKSSVVFKLKLLFIFKFRSINNNGDENFKRMKRYV